MLLHTFMTHYMHASVQQWPDAEVAYIAQHPLFDQLPSLLADFEQPELMGGEAVEMNAWIGTRGTVTPLHYDSYDNFLAQVCNLQASKHRPALLRMPHLVSWEYTGNVALDAYHHLSEGWGHLALLEPLCGCRCPGEPAVCKTCSVVVCGNVHDCCIDWCGCSMLAVVCICCTSSRHIYCIKLAA